MKRLSRVVTRDGVTYLARREGLKRDGCDPPRMWYWTVDEPKLGPCIDERVPEEHYSTLTSALYALARHLGVTPGDL